MERNEKVLKIAKEKGIVRASDLEAEGISRNYLYAFCKSGLLQKLSRGLYTLPDGPITEHINLIEVAKRIPNTVICLISALSFHDLTTQIPHEIWVTLPRGAWRPKIDYPPLNLTYVSGDAYSFGIQEHIIQGVAVKMYSPAKTVADCFKFRNKVGMDVAMEAIRDVWRSRKATMDELVKAAEICKVSKVMLPRLEAII
ncbi:MAG: transcriptional regulator [Deltaproteobacteria bacterium]|nr:transcriptional regulator [Deltaproteobacteria bacterium]MBT4090879.1 transcriptional regulator [Deltaproteobacteria bacterium]MBT4267298.1 transcriptional regulator [Deltaproteobacteria bacterium]MBT4639931.1 transcriptional regulator [Deltaproteobacteria bacterium]MBT6616327.1 transcriptional regulator [Deltaproteobacteria bacterium]